MLRVISSVIFALLIFVTISSAQPAGPRGRITVTVVDQQGEPVPSATVKFGPPPGTIISGGVPDCETDASGTCSRKHLPMDTYYVRAVKPYDVYPDLPLEFYSRQTKPIPVAVTPGDPDHKVLFKLGPKAGTLKLNVFDETSGAALNNPAVFMRNASSPKAWISINRRDDSTVLIPPDEDVLIEIYAAKYQGWKLVDHLEVAGGKALRLEPGEKREWTIHIKHK